MHSNVQESGKSDWWTNWRPVFCGSSAYAKFALDQVFETPTIVQATRRSCLAASNLIALTTDSSRHGVLRRVRWPLWLRAPGNGAEAAAAGAKLGTWFRDKEYGLQLKAIKSGSEALTKTESPRVPST